MNDTTDRLPAVRTDTTPIPVISDDSAPVIHVTYPELDPSSLDAAWVNTGDGEGVRTGVFNQQVYRTLEVIADRVQRTPWVTNGLTVDLAWTPDRGLQEHVPAEALALRRRTAVVLIADPLSATPFRCPSCGIHYTAPPAPADWKIAGRGDLPCRICTHTEGIRSYTAKELGDAYQRAIDEDKPGDQQRWMLQAEIERRADLQTTTITVTPAQATKPGRRRTTTRNKP